MPKVKFDKKKILRQSENDEYLEKFFQRKFNGETFNRAKGFDTKEEAEKYSKTLKKGIGSTFKGIKFKTIFDSKIIKAPKKRKQYGKYEVFYKFKGNE